MHIAEHYAEPPKLYEAIQIGSDRPSKNYNPTFHIKVPFFNPKERFDIVVFFDEAADDCNVHCRIEDVKSPIKRGDFISTRDLLEGFTWAEAAKMIIGLVVALALSIFTTIYFLGVRGRM
jgi:hypothetical protein